MLRELDSDHAEIIRRTIQFMKAHLDESLSLEDMAEEAGFSTFHFNRLFRKVTGIPPRLFLSALRMEKAKELLLMTDADVTEIAMSVGYSSFGSFSTRFSRSVGVSPHLFRKCYQQGLKAIAAFKETTEPDRSMNHPPAIKGKLAKPESFDGVIFVGLFPKPIPNVRPVCGTVLKSSSHYHFDKVPDDGIYYVMAAAFRWSDSKRTLLLPRDSLRGMADGPVFINRGIPRGYMDVTLREADLTDPPILISLPILLAERLNAAN
ncbi:MAG TPA: AraC family transcriptional regulator [Bacillales bacterium]|nr:AraC family transcriptional regulator [Bacillales bacterium]